MAKERNEHILKQTFNGGKRGFFFGIGLFILVTLMLGANEIFTPALLVGSTTIGTVIGALLGFFKGLKKPEIFNHFCQGKHDTTCI